MVKDCATALWIFPYCTPSKSNPLTYSNNILSILLLCQSFFLSSYENKFQSGLIIPIHAEKIPWPFWIVFLFHTFNMGHSVCIRNWVRNLNSMQFSSTEEDWARVALRPVFFVPICHGFPTMKLPLIIYLSSF